MPTLPNSPARQSMSLKPGDILFVLLRNKWKFLGAVILGLICGAGLFTVEKPTYVSDAKVMVRYVMETRSLGPVSGVRQIKDTDQGAQSVLNSELQIITSGDLYEKVAQVVGPKRLLGDSGPTNTVLASGVIFKGLTVQVPTRSDVMILTFRHQDPEVARDVLKELIKAYISKHSEVHHSSDSFDFLQGQTEEVRIRLGQTEDELRKLKTEAGVISLEAARTEIPTRISTLRQSISSAEAELAQETAFLQSYGVHASGTNVLGTNRLGAFAQNQTNNSAELTHLVEGPNRTPIRTATEIAQAKQTATRLNAQLAALQQEELKLKVSLTENAKPLQLIREQIADVRGQLEAVEAVSFEGEPAHAVNVAFPGRQAGASKVDVNSIAGLQAKVKALKEQLKLAQQEATKLEASEEAIRRVERRRELEENQYKYFYTGLEQAKIDNALGSGKVNNISIVQSPSVPRRSKDDHIKALMMLVLPLLLLTAYLGVVELAFPSSFRRANEIEDGLQLPVLVSIPHFGVNGHSKLKLRKARDSNSEITAGEIPPWDPSDPMIEYYEALRDRIVMSYNGDVHKPKIIGITGCEKGAGVSRVATGLAAALSRDLERRVLYIALAKSKVMVSAFEKGRPAEYVPQSGETRGELSDNEQFVNQNLACLATSGRGISGAGIVQSFSDLLPKLKHSEFDYIVFDLPPLTQTSGSLRLAAQMERTLLMVEAEKSKRQKLEKAKALLQGSQTQLAAVLNKAKPYGKKAFQADL